MGGGHRGAATSGSALGGPGTGIGRYWDQPPAGVAAATVLLLHGWAGTADLNWSAAYQPLLAAGFRVLSLDLLGHGLGARDRPFTLEAAADAAATLVRGAGVAKVVVAGHSMGGSVALLFARRHPDLTAGLVLMATQATWPGIPPRWMLLPAGRLAALASRPLLSHGARSILGTDPQRNAWIHDELRPSSMRHLAQALVAMREFDARPWLNEITVPTIVLVTTRDTLVEPERQRHLAAQIPSAGIIEVEIDHSDPPSRPGPFPERLVAAVRACLEDGRPPGPVSNSA